MIGGAIALVLVALIIGALVLLGGSPAASPSAASTPAATAVPAPARRAPTRGTHRGPDRDGNADRDDRRDRGAGTMPGSPAPSASRTPSVDSLKGPRSASCTGTNGTAPPGYIHLTWTASNTTGVRLSIDPPAPNDAYDYGYDDYPAIGSADVPFTCDPPKSDARRRLPPVRGDDRSTTSGYFAYRYLKVYVRT